MMTCTYKEMGQIHLFLNWISIERIALMSEQQEQYFKNAKRWFDNIYTTSVYVKSIITATSDDYDVRSRISIPFELMMDLASLNRSYLDDYKKAVKNDI